MCLLPEYDDESVDSAYVDVSWNPDSDDQLDSIQTLVVHLSHLTVSSTVEDYEETDDGSQFRTCVLYSDDI